MLNSFTERVDVLAVPFSLGLMLVCSLIYIYQHHIKSTSLQWASFQYDLIVHQRQLWRIFTAIFSHGGITHLLFNMCSVWQQAWLEKELGTMLFMKISFLMMVIAALVTTAASAVMIRTRFSHIGHQSCVGYSGILFAWLAWESLLSPYENKILFVIPMVHFLVPFIMLVLLQVLAPNVSFMAHAAGIAAGYIVFFIKPDIFGPRLVDIDHDTFWFKNWHFYLCIIMTSGVSLYSWHHQKLASRVQQCLPTTHEEGGPSNPTW